MKSVKYLVLILFVIMQAGYAQEDIDPEVSTDVPELHEFHKTIYTLWHTAWPDKDYEMLKSLIPDIEKGYQKIKDVELPGILRHKKDTWENHVNSLKHYVEKYKLAASKGEKKQLLDAAENIHSQFEHLVRTIRPVLHEMEEFHKSVYVLFHYYTPEYDYSKIKETVSGMVLKMENLMKAELPRRLEDQKGIYEKAINSLNESVQNLYNVVNNGNDKEAINKAVDTMHTRYQELEAMFD